jgi:hypothetical protein
MSNDVSNDVSEDTTAVDNVSLSKNTKGVAGRPGLRGLIAVRFRFQAAHNAFAVRYLMQVAHIAVRYCRP